MRYRKRGWHSPGIAVATLAGFLLAAGCTTPTQDVAQAPGRSGQPTDTGSYPNLNIPRQAATTQFTQEEAQAKLAQLSALQERQNPGRGSQPESAAARKRLKVAADEQEDTLKIIEGE